MDKYRTLDQLANSFNAIRRMQEIRGMTVRSDDRSSVRPSNSYILTEMLKVIRDYSPSPRKEALDQAINKTSLYSTAYANLKQHIRTSSRQNFNLDDAARALSILTPVMSSSKRVIADKLLRIYEILKA